MTDLTLDEAHEEARKRHPQGTAWIQQGNCLVGYREHGLNGEGSGPTFREALEDWDRRITQAEAGND